MVRFLSAISKGLDYISAPLSQPKTFFTKGPTAAAKAVKASRLRIAGGDKKQALKVIGTTLASTAVAATAVVGGAATAASVKAVGAKATLSKAAMKAAHAAKWGKKLPSPVKKVATLGVGAAVLAPRTFKTAVKNPAVTKTVVAGAINPGLGVVTAIEQGTSLIKESVMANQSTLKTAGVVAGSALAAGAGIYGVNKLLKSGKEVAAKTPEVLGKAAPPVQTAAKVPLTPQTSEVVPTPPKTQPKTAKGGGNITQKTIVNVVNRNTKKYLNGVMLKM